MRTNDRARKGNALSPIRIIARGETSGSDEPGAKQSWQRQSMQRFDHRTPNLPPPTEVEALLVRIHALEVENENLRAQIAITKEWQLIGEAAAQLNMCDKTLKRKAAKWGFGRNVDGRWQIHMPGAQTWRKTGSCEPL